VHHEQEKKREMHLGKIVVAMSHPEIWRASGIGEARPPRQTAPAKPGPVPNRSRPGGSTVYSPITQVIEQDWGGDQVRRRSNAKLFCRKEAQTIGGRRRLTRRL
jgi:hypothetical protein